MSSFSEETLPLIVGVTGHRDLRSEDIPHLEDRVREILNDLEARYPNSPLMILSPLGEGADRLVARVGLAEGAGLCVPLPMPRERYESEFEDDASRAEFRELLARADRAFSLPWIGEGAEGKADYGTSGPESANQYARMGAYLARHCQVLLALWDGVKEHEMVGGTAQIVRFRLDGVPPPFGPAQALLDPADSASVVHIVTPRRSNPHPEGEPFSREVLVPKGFAKSERDRTLANLETFNAEVKTNPAAREADANIAMLIPGKESAAIPETAQPYLRTFGLADALSIWFQRSTRRTLERVFFAVFLAALFFNLFHSLPHASHGADGDAHGEAVVQLHEDSPEPPAAHGPEDHSAEAHESAGNHSKSEAHHDGHGAVIPWFLWLYLILVTGNVWYHRRAERREYQNKYQDYRALAEGLRVQFFWSLAGMKEEAADHYLGKERGELEWIRHALRIRKVLSDAASDGTENGGEPNEEVLRRVQRDWIREQQRYFVSKTHREMESLERSEKWIRTMLGLSVGLTVALAVVLTAPVFLPWAPLEAIKSWVEVPLPHGWVMILIVMFAVAAGLLHSLNQLKARGEHAKRFGRMALLFDRAERHFEDWISSGRSGDIPALLLELGKEALAENADWVMLHRERPLQVPHAA
ncbi:MAG: hypothetical protein KDN19_02735 [Verrucomicrobiae bacterium]|nr:hypothetical protein [Verrucomicrobiae bacterium]